MKLSSALLPAMVLCPAMLAAQNQQQKPNIVLFFVDDFGFMTPNIDYFAKNNINFTAAYVPSPTSSPSRAGLLTGQYPIRAGLIRHISEYPKDINNGSHYELWDQDPGAKYNIKELT
ncbi:MAG: sulfatase-like hydrolase/transferase, partial [Mucinivorans sp.]